MWLFSLIWMGKCLKLLTKIEPISELQWRKEKTVRDKLLAIPTSKKDFLCSFLRFTSSHVIFSFYFFNINLNYESFLIIPASSSWKEWTDDFMNSPIFPSSISHRQKAKHFLSRDLNSWTYRYFPIFSEGEQERLNDLKNDDDDDLQKRRFRLMTIF